MNQNQPQKMSKAAATILWVWAALGIFCLVLFLQIVL